MKDKNNTGEHPISEFNAMQKRITALAASETELKNALKESQARFRLLFERSVDPALLLEGYRFVDCNEAALRILHCPQKDQLLGLRPSQISPERQPDGQLSAKKEESIISLLEKEGSSHFEWVHRTLDEEDFWVEVSLTGILLKGKRLAYVVWRDITERKLTEGALRKNTERLESINASLLSLGSDYNTNMQRLTALCGELLGAFCALYNHLEKGMLCSLGQWHTPPDYSPRDNPEGHLCYDVIRRGDEGVILVRNLSRTSYAESDPNVRAYGLQTYLGHVVKCNGQPVGSLCVVYQEDYTPAEDDMRIMGIIASAVGNEETRMQSDEALRESEERYRNIFENAVEGIFQTTPHGRYVTANPALARMFGYDSPQEMIDTVHSIGQQQYVDPEDRIRLKELYRNPGFVEGYEILVRKKDMQTFWISINARAVKNAEGEILYYEGTTEDVTERKKAEQALKESRQRLCDIIQFLPDATFAIDKEGKVIAWNRAAEEMTGVKAGEMLGKGNYEHAIPFYGTRRPIVIDLTLVPDREIEDNYSFVHRENGFLIAESYVPFPGREGRFLWGKAAPMYNTRGEIIGAIESVRDITEHKRAEEELRKHREHLEELVEERTAELKTTNEALLFEITEHRKAEEEIKERELRYRELADLLPQTVFECDETGNITFVNHSFFDTFGYTREDFDKALCAHQMVVPEERDKVGEVIQKILAGEEMRGVEYTALRKDGTTFPVLTYGNRIMRGEKISGLRGIVIDITEYMQALEDLKESENNFRQFVSAMPGPISLLDSDGTTLISNESKARILGLTMTELIGRNAFSSLPAELAATRKALFDKVISTKQSVRIEEKVEDNTYETLVAPIKNKKGEVIKVAIFPHDVTERKQAEEEREKLILELQEALKKVKTLSGLLPICASCKKIRNDKGYWEQMEGYIRDHSEAEFSHSICPECAQKLYPEYYKKK